MIILSHINKSSLFNKLFSTKFFNLSLIIIFVLLGYFKILTHEMWRDELFNWMVVKDSPTLKLFFSNLRYAEQPPLWYLILFTLTTFTNSLFNMQLLHLLIATLTTYLLIKYSTLTKLQKFLWIFGYFPAYEYLTITRTYVIGALFIFLFCITFKPNKPNLILSAILLNLLAFTNLYGLTLAVAIASMTGMTFLFNKIFFKKIMQNQKKNLIISILVFSLGIALSLYLSIPIPNKDRINSSSLISGYRLIKALSTIWRSYVPIPMISLQFWNTNFLDSWLIPEALLSLQLFLYFIVLFLNKPKILWLYLIGTCSLVIFFYGVFGGIRHQGYLFILLIMCLWLSNYIRQTPIKIPLLRKLNIVCGKFKQTVITFLLIIHAGAGLFATYTDMIYPFSNAKFVANYIQKQDLAQMTILGEPDLTASAVSAFLTKKFYYPNTGNYGSYVMYTKQRLFTKQRKDVTLTETLEQATNLVKKEKKDILLVLNYPIPENISTIYKITLLKDFGKSIVADENYTLYLMKYLENGKIIEK